MTLPDWVPAHFKDGKCCDVDSPEPPGLEGSSAWSRHHQLYDEDSWDGKGFPVNRKSKPKSTTKLPDIDFEDQPNGRGGEKTEWYVRTSAEPEPDSRGSLVSRTDVKATTSGPSGALREEPVRDEDLRADETEDEPGPQPDALAASQVHTTEAAADMSPGPSLPVLGKRVRKWDSDSDGDTEAPWPTKRVVSLWGLRR